MTDSTPPSALAETGLRLPPTHPRNSLLQSSLGREHPSFPTSLYLLVLLTQVCLGEGRGHPGHGEQPPHPPGQKRLPAHLTDVVGGHRHVHLPGSVSRGQRLSQCTPARQVRATCPGPEQTGAGSNEKPHFGRPPGDLGPHTFSHGTPTHPSRLGPLQEQGSLGMALDRWAPMPERKICK